MIQISYTDVSCDDIVSLQSSSNDSDNNKSTKGKFAWLMLEDIVVQRDPAHVSGKGSRLSKGTCTRKVKNTHIQRLSKDAISRHRQVTY